MSCKQHTSLIDKILQKLGVVQKPISQPLPPANTPTPPDSQAYKSFPPGSSFSKTPRGSSSGTKDKYPEPNLESDFLNFLLLNQMVHSQQQNDSAGIDSSNCAINLNLDQNSNSCEPTINFDHHNSCDFSAGFDSGSCDSSPSFDSGSCDCSGGFDGGN